MIMSYLTKVEMSYSGYDILSEKEGGYYVWQGRDRDESERDKAAKGDSGCARRQADGQSDIKTNRIEREAGKEIDESSS
jgi:hypothetical protein